MALLIKTKLIPVKFLVLAGVVFLLFVLGVAFFTRDSRRIGGLIFGTVMTAVILIIVTFATGYIVKGVNTLSQITETTVELADVGIYVSAEDEATAISDTSGYTFGIMDVLDRDNTDKAIADIEETLGSGLNVIEYAGLAELADSLLVTGETNAIIMNSAYLELFSDMEGYENVSSQLKEVHVQQVENVIERVVEKQETEKKHWWQIFTKDDEEDVAEGEDTAAKTSTDVFSMYISGIDSRSGLIAKSRSDVNIIATVNADTHQILLVSTPRDFYVPLSISNGVPDKLTHAGIYGIDVSMGTLEMLYETEIDYYFRVNFSGFERIINELGGITVNSEYSFSSGGYYFSAGENYLDGAAALVFSRERYAFASGDRQRGRNQMAVIKGVIQKAMSPTLLTNYTSIMESVSGSFETSVPYDVLAKLVRNQLSNGGEWNIVSYSVDGTGASKKPYSLSTNAYVMVPDYSTVETAIAMMNQVKAGEILTSN